MDFFTANFLVQKFTVFRSRGFVAVPIAAFYVRKSIFRNFSTVVPPVDLVETIGLRIHHLQIFS
jgi:hypothetical protein